MASGFLFGPHFPPGAASGIPEGRDHGGRAVSIAVKIVPWISMLSHMPTQVIQWKTYEIYEHTISIYIYTVYIYEPLANLSEMAMEGERERKYGKKTRKWRAKDGLMGTSSK